MPDAVLSWRPIFEALNANKIRYVIVGGLAVVLHGHARLTGDVDLMVDLEEKAALRTIETLADLGLRSSLPLDITGFGSEATRNEWQARNMAVLNLSDMSAGRSVDIFINNPIDFEDVWSRSVLTDYRGIEVRIASIEDLIELKRRAGRPEDLLDISYLLKLQRLRAEGNGDDG